MPLEESRFDLAEMARRLVEATQVTTAATSCSVEAAGPVLRAGRPPPRRAGAAKSAGQRHQVLAERRRTSAVAVETAPATPERPPRAVVHVRDEGIGMTREAAARAFERFYQAGTAPVRGHVGLGLGLYISREIVTRHGGEMWVESEPNQGSTFSFSLPLRDPRPSTGERPDDD